MMTTDESERVPYSAWGVSVCLHTLIVGLAFMITAQVQPILKEEIFQWEIALVQSSPDSPQTETSQSIPTVQPSKPTPVRTAQPVETVEPTSDMVMTRVASQYSPEIVHPTIVPPKPELQPDVVQAKVTPVEPQEIKKEEVKKEETRPQEVVKPEPVAPAQAYEPHTPSHSHHAEATEVAGTLSPSPEEIAPEWRPLVPAGEGSAKAVTEPAAASSVPIESSAVGAAPVQAQASVPLVAKASPVRPATKADNAWLAESLGRRIKELTRYPSSARLNGSEGKVVLRVVLRADGHLVDVVVHRSSGHEVLDRAAMETVRLACPIHMKQALSAAEVAVYVPIVYSLAG
jgi:protein TonB